MTLLQIMDDTDGKVLHRTEDVTAIEAELRPHKIGFDRWAAAVPLAADAGAEEVLEAYRKDVDLLCERGGYLTVDVVRMTPSDDPGWVEKATAAREKFLEEHTHDEDEVRFFVEGRGCFYLHLGDRVYATVCEAGDLLSVPTGTRHWFDMGTRPHFTAIRFFQKEDGWVGNFTGDPVARSIPYLDQLLETAL